MSWGLKFDEGGSSKSKRIFPLPPGFVSVDSTALFPPNYHKPKCPIVHAKLESEHTELGKFCILQWLITNANN